MIPIAGAPVRFARRSAPPVAAFVLSLTLSLITTGQAVAQRRSPPVFTLLGGPSSYKLAGRGTTYAIGGRFDESIGHYVIFEPGFTFLSYQPTVAGRVNYLMPEISLQGQGYLGPIRPFVGTGIGFASVTNGPNLSRTTLHAVGGVRLRLHDAWGLRLEFRARSVEPWYGRTFDFLAGISRVMTGGM